MFTDFTLDHTVKPILRGHLWDKEKLSFKTGDSIKEIQFT